jgi:hypothetical protein
LSSKHNATITRLRARIDAALAARGLAPAIAVIGVPVGMEAQEATVIGKHYALFPEDKAAKQTVIMRRFGPVSADTPVGSHANARISAASRALAREQKQAQPLGFWAAPSENSLMPRS